MKTNMTLDFPNDDDIPFSRLLFDPMVWQVQPPQQW